MPRSMEITLGDKPCTLRQLRTKPASDWRRSLEGPAREITGQLMGLMKAQETKIDDVESLAGLLGLAMPLVLNSLDTIRELLAGYAPDLSQAIDDAYDDELVAMLVQVLKLAFPFGDMANLIRQVQTLGQAASPTSPN